MAKLYDTFNLIGERYEEHLVANNEEQLNNEEAKYRKKAKESEARVERRSKELEKEKKLRADAETEVEMMKGKLIEADEEADAIVKIYRGGVDKMEAATRRLKEKIAVERARHASERAQYEEKLRRLGDHVRAVLKDEVLRLKLGQAEGIFDICRIMKDKMDVPIPAKVFAKLEKDKAKFTEHLEAVLVPGVHMEDLDLLPPPEDDFTLAELDEMFRAGFLHSLTGLGSKEGDEARVPATDAGEGASGRRGNDEPKLPGGAGDGGELSGAEPDT